jgi:hypothetical protein
MNGLMKNEHGEIGHQRTREAITRSNIVLGSDN